MTGLLLPLLAFLLVAGAVCVWAVYRLSSATRGKVEPTRTHADGTPWPPP